MYVSEVRTNSISRRKKCFDFFLLFLKGHRDHQAIGHSWLIRKLGEAGMANASPVPTSLCNNSTIILAYYGKAKEIMYSLLVRILIFQRGP